MELIIKMALEDINYKNVHRYTAADQEQAPIIEKLYVKKYAFKGQKAPKEIEVKMVF